MTIEPLTRGLCMNIVPFLVFKHVTKMILLKLKKKVDMHNTIQRSYLSAYFVGRSIFISLLVITLVFPFFPF